MARCYSLIIPSYECFAAVLCAVLGITVGDVVGANVVEPLRLAQVDSTWIDGDIDWTEQVLTAYGEAVAPADINDPAKRRLMGMRGAKVVAMRNLKEIVGQVRIDARTRLDRAMVVSDDVRVGVNGVLLGARLVPGSMTDVDGVYRVAVQIGLRQKFAAAVLPQTDTLLVDPLSEIMAEMELAAFAGGEAEHQAADSRFADVDSMRLAADLTDGAELSYERPRPYTGLLVDARGLDLQASMAPRILSPAGYEVYGNSFAERSAAARLGIAGYFADISQARVSDRLGGEDAHAMEVVALDVVGRLDGDVVIGPEDAVNVRIADREWDFLRECRVVFVVGPEQVATDSAVVDSAYLNVDLLEAQDYNETGFEFSD